MKLIGREVERTWRELREEKDHNQGLLHENVNKYYSKIILSLKWKLVFVFP